MPKRTYRPSKKKKSKTHGYRMRNRTKLKRKVLKRRFSKGRRRGV